MSQKFSDQDLLRLAKIVTEETGNLVQQKNFSMIEARLRGRMIRLEIDSIEKYWDYFNNHEDSEREALKSLMTTHYTFFFREYLHFEALHQWIEGQCERLISQWKENKKPVRIWSAACSRGQEAYSLALFCEKNLKEKYGISYEIYATDIDAESIQYAKNGVYPIKEVNAIPHTYIGSYWKKGSGPLKDFAAIVPHIKSTVHFSQVNLLEVKNPAGQEKFDAIFCRNVLIYFSEENSKKIAKSLYEYVNEPGLLITGASEPLRFSDWPLQSISPSVYTKGEAKEPVAIQEVKQKSNTVSIATSPNKYKVLCVDDSPTIQTLIKKIFSQDPLCSGVDVAFNGLDARAKLDKGEYHIITLDIHMPEMNGIEFLEKSYNKQKDPPVIMISSVNRTDVDLATKALSLGALDYIEKPSMNNLKKIADELLTKVKMALEVQKRPELKTEISYDQSIGQKIVVPDASICLRVVYADERTTNLLEQVIRGQHNEYRSPGLVVIWRGSENISQKITAWTQKPSVVVSTEQSFFRPNTLTVVLEKDADIVLKAIRAKNISLQILTADFSCFDFYKNFKTAQVLLDESIQAKAADFERTSSLKVSDITPSTSFASLSLEYFANLRKAAA